MVRQELQERQVEQAEGVLRDVAAERDAGHVLTEILLPVR